MNRRSFARTAIAAALAAGVGLAAGPAGAAQQGRTEPRGEAGVFAIENARILVANGPTIERGTVVIRDGRIEAVGAAVAAPAGARRIDGAGLTVYPGLIDSWTQLGLIEVSSVPALNDTTEVGDFKPELKAYEAFNPNSEFIPVSRAAGVTTVVSAPAGGVFSGQPALVSLEGDTVDDMAVRQSVGHVFSFPSQVGGRSFDFATFQPRTTSDTEAKKQRDKRLDEVRTLLRDAEAYLKAVDARVADPTLPLMARDRRLEALRPVLRGELPVLVTARDERDIRAAVAFADEMKLKMVLKVPGSSDVAKVAPLLAQKRIPVVIGSLFALPYREDDRYDLPQLAPAALVRAGVRFGFATEESAMVKDLPFVASMAVAYGGLTREDALRAMTIWPAEIWGVSDRLGSIEPGKVANLVVATGDPMEVSTVVKHVFVNGRLVPLDNRQQRFADRYDVK